MHVALISSDCLPNPGGVAAHFYHLAIALDSLGVQVTALGGCQDERRSGPFRPPFPGFRVKTIGSHNKFSTAKFIVWARRRLRETMRTSHIDLAHVHNLIGDPVALIGLTRGMRRVATNHSSGFLIAFDRGRKKHLYPLLLGGYDAVIAPSRELERKSPYLGVPEKRVFYVPNGVDGRRFSPGDAGADAWSRIAPFSPRHRIVLATRRLERKNGMHVFLRSIPTVVKACPEARYVLAGDGSQRRALVLEARRRGLERFLLFLGTVPNDKLLGLYRLASVCVLPSLIEATSISGLEAMACGIPLIGSRVGGIPEIVQDGVTGILVEPNHPDDLASGIVRLLQDRDHSEALGARGRARAKRDFSWATIASKTLAVYEDCMRTCPK